MYPQSRGGTQNNVLKLNTALRGPTGYREAKLTAAADLGAWAAGDRPVTQQGMAGLRPLTSGPRRKVLSKSYFLVLLKQKIAELSAETGRFRARAESLGAQQLEADQAQQRQQQLLVEVRRREGRLADFNLAMDKHRGGARADELRAVQEHIAAQNQRLSAQVDDLFIRRRNVEDQARSLTAQIAELRANSELKINELTAEQRAAWLAAEADLARLAAEAETRRGCAEALTHTLAEQAARLGQDPQRLKALKAREALGALEARRDELERKLAENALSFGDLRQRLMERIREDKAEIGALEKRTRELRRLLETAQRRLARLEEEHSQTAVTEEQRQKFEVLYAKELELKAAAEEFEQACSAKLAELARLEAQNLHLLAAAAKHALVAKLRDAGDAADDRTRLLAGVFQQRDELRKLEEIEQTLPERITAMHARATQLRAEVGQLRDPQAELQRVQQQTAQMRGEQQRLAARNEQLEGGLAEAQSHYNARLAALQAHRIFQEFVDLEKRLSHSHQLLHNIQSYIRHKEGEAVHQAALRKVFELTAEINKVLSAK